MPLRTAVLYSGRFYGDLTPALWISNHVEHLLMPYNASVFVVAEPSSWCHVKNLKQARHLHNPSHRLHNASAANELSALFEVEVRRMFAPYWSDVHAALLPDEDTGRRLTWYPPNLHSLYLAAIEKTHGSAKMARK
eukprot:5269212-Prymnesium_polylepis.1